MDVEYRLKHVVLKYLKIMFNQIFVLFVWMCNIERYKL